MKATVLLYHDVIAGPGDLDASGFPGPGPGRYKLDAARFDDHLAALARVLTAPPALAVELGIAEAPVVLTFDDGGRSALTIATRLEERGWRGCFFIPTDRLGEASFLAPAEVQDLYSRGHVVGSHSASHPPRLSALPLSQILGEWTRSRQRLEDLLGAAVGAASVPGGYVSRRVIAAATAAGFDRLFTSEPTRRLQQVEGCLVAGRFSLRRHSPASAAAALAGRRPWARLAQRLAWDLRKVAKAVGGEAYLALRRRLLGSGR